MTSHQNSTFEELAAEFPCLIDPQDRHFRDNWIKNHCLRQLLEKCNRVSSIPVTMEDIRRKLKSQSRHRRYQAKLKRQKSSVCSPTTNSLGPAPLQAAPLGDAVSTQGTSENDAATPSSTTNPKPVPRTSDRIRRQQLEELVPEYPCLWDSKDLNYTNPVLKAQCQEKLLAKYNSLSRSTITLEQLNKELELLRGRQSEHRLRAAGLDLSAEDSRGGSLSDPGSSNSTDPVYQTQCVVLENPNQQTPLFNILLHCCGVCGELRTVRSDCLNVTDKPYIENNKTKLAINDLSIELDFDKQKTVCQNCDTKLKEIYDFVKQVKSAQNKMYVVNVADERDNVMTIGDHDNDGDRDQKVIADTQTVTDTGLVNPNILHKNKCEENPEKKKMCRVTIDLNSCDNDRNTMDDIAVKYQMFKKKVSVSNSKAADKAANVTVTEDSEVISLIGKEEVETDDEHDKNDETGEMFTVEDIESNDQSFRNNDVVSRATSNESAHHSRMVITEDNDDILFDVKKEMGTDDVHTEVDETGEIVTDNHMRDEQTNETASVVSELAKKGEAMCVIPKSELIQLVESIVSRMLNK